MPGLRGIGDTSDLSIGIFEASRSLHMGEKDIDFRSGPSDFQAPALEPALVDRTAEAVFAEKGVKLKIGVYANAFETDTDDKAANEGLHDTRGDLTGDVYSRFACDWAEAGATMIGGCCGIGAEHIHRVAGALRARA